MIKTSNKKFQIGLVIFFSILYLFTNQAGVRSPNDASRIHTIIELVEKHTFILDDAPFRVADEVYRDGHYYSSKPPFLSILGAGVYFVLYHFLNMTWATHSPAIYLIVTYVLVDIPMLLILLTLYRLLFLFDIEERDRRIFTFTLGISTLFLTYSSTLNNHIPAAFLFWMGFYFLIKPRFNTGSDILYAFLSGLFSATASIINIVPGVFLIPAFFLAWLKRYYKQKKIIISFMAGVGIFVVVGALLNIPVTGNILPAQMQPKLYHYPEGAKHLLDGYSIWRDMNIPYFRYTFNAFFGVRGLFSYTPLLLLVFLSSRKKSVQCFQPFKQELFFTLLGVSGMFAMYSYFFRSYGGWAYGFRWFIPVTPILYFLIFPYFIHPPFKYHRLIFIFLSIISFIVAFVGLYQPWPMIGYPDSFYVNTLTLFFDGNLSIILRKYFSGLIAIINLLKG